MTFLSSHVCFTTKQKIEQKCLKWIIYNNNNSQIVDKIDANKDGLIVEEELNNWIKNVTHKKILKDVESRWYTIEKNNSLEGYLETNYGILKSCKI